MENVIQLKKRNTLSFEIVDENGNKTGESIEFDLENLELPIKYQESLDRHMRNKQSLEMQFIAIDKKQDVTAGKDKGTKILTRNEEEKYEVLKEFYKREIEALDLFLGKNGCKKLLNGREPYYSMFEDINDVIEPILPKLKIHADDLINGIKNKYEKKEDNVLE